MLNSQFVKLPNTLQKEDISVQVMWSMAAFYLTIPNFSGSLRTLIHKCCEKNTPVIPTWRTLRKKYLKYVKIPTGKTNSFEYRWELYSTDRSDVNDRELTSEAGIRYLKSNPQHKVFQTGYYTKVYTSVLKDNRLSLKAKGIHIVIYRLFELQKHNCDVSISKQEVMRRLHCKRSSIEAGWTELKKVGYLHQSRYTDDIRGTFAWGYEWYAEPVENKNINTVKITHKREKPIVEEHRATEIALTRAERNAIRETIRTNIEYDVLIDRFSKDDVDSIEHIMLDVICSKKPTTFVGGQAIETAIVREAFMQINCDDIINLFERFNATPSQGKISNLRAYKLTSLYNVIASRGYAVV